MTSLELFRPMAGGGVGGAYPEWGTGWYRRTHDPANIWDTQVPKLAPCVSRSISIFISNTFHYVYVNIKVEKVMPQIE